MKQTYETDGLQPDTVIENRHAQGAHTSKPDTPYSKHVETRNFSSRKASLRSLPGDETFAAATSNVMESIQELLKETSSNGSVVKEKAIEDIHLTVRDEHLQDALGHTIEVAVYSQYKTLYKYYKIEAIIDAKAASLGYGPNDGGSLIAVPHGYFKHYSFNDIYYNENGQAFEVQGDIRAKYNMLGGANGSLGVPLTDETVAPDTVGRYNHFEGGSIYWTPTTGPMSVRGAVRNRWAATGWELGPMGYPVQDQVRMIQPFLNTPLEWCRFQNGVIASDNNGGAEALAAILTYGEVGAIFGARINAQMQASPDNVAMRSGMDLTGVSDWQYDFWSSRPRSISFRFRGFHDNGLAPDTDFAINISLSFKLVNPQVTPMFYIAPPIHMTLVAQLEFLRVIHEGGPPVVGGKVVSGVSKAISESFYQPDPAHPEVPPGCIFVGDVETIPSEGVVNVLDVMVARNGDLQILVNPLRYPNQPNSSTINWGLLRQYFAQNKLDGLKA